MKSYLALIGLKRMVHSYGVRLEKIKKMRKISFILSKFIIPMKMCRKSNQDGTFMRTHQGLCLYTEFALPRAQKRAWLVAGKFLKEACKVWIRRNYIVEYVLRSKSNLKQTRKKIIHSFWFILVLQDYRTLIKCQKNQPFNFKKINFF